MTIKSEHYNNKLNLRDRRRAIKTNSYYTYQEILTDRTLQSRTLSSTLELITKLK